MDVVIANDIGIIGFDAGDRQRSATVQSRERDNFNLQNLNIFRIDGMYKAVQSPFKNLAPYKRQG